MINNSFANAISAYRNAADGKTDTIADRANNGTAVDPGQSFSDMVRDAAVDARDTMMNSETMTQKAIVGKAELHDVVTAVSAAEVTLKTVVGVRDKALQAYQEILRMPI
ncbi:MULTISPECIES: flagellar hook-basal body complex protein FliE [unclassified Thalassospira]|jgi:flagellar hook-basal body complex protein FliE|uniref:flagellar hook-basal body complex protein FliE n=1 Tax=unclassified Thalassospira TaxID=2648997 RepID=UPI000A1E8C61|nr:flagellar hook-basal body complex protein FliE [Thalassospira sp. MCCC 1A01428]OSQ44185.1 flagellar hook-basal body protein FliE [Thalassospira sp. MCCC 1A01428]